MSGKFLDVALLSFLIYKMESTLALVTGCYEAQMNGRTLTERLEPHLVHEGLGS